MNRDEFFDALLLRTPENAAAFDREHEARLGTEGSVLVCDSSGFTRITRESGILHFLALLAQSYRLARPIVAEHGGALVKTEADNLIALFSEPAAAVRCALDIQRAHADRNAVVPDAERFELSVGVDHGHYLRLDDDAFGDAINTAYKVGEDLAHAGEILLTDRLVARLGGPAAMPEGIALEQAGTHDAGRVAITLFRVSLHG